MYLSAAYAWDIIFQKYLLRWAIIISKQAFDVISFIYTVEVVVSTRTYRARRDQLWYLGADNGGLMRQEAAWRNLYYHFVW